MTTKPPYSQSLELQNARARVKELERELNEVNSTLDTITTDVDYGGGVQYWLKKNSQLMRDNLSILQQLTAARELNKKMFEALDRLSHICTCSRPAKMNSDGGITAPGPHTNRCVHLIANKVLALARSQGFGKETI